MNESKVKTLRHIEAVRNFLNASIVELLHRAEEHDQSKLQSPEVEIFDEYTHKLRDCTYGSDEYKMYLREMQIALDHHYAHNRHHPEFFGVGAGSVSQCTQSPLSQMNLIDLVEMVCDWKAATLRHVDGDIYKSIELNQKRFGYSDEMSEILRNTAEWLDSKQVPHFAEES